MPTLALALEHPNHLGYLQERQQMIKWILGASLIVLGINKLIDLQDSNPNIGIPLTIIIGGLWIFSVAQLINEKRR